MDEQKLTCMVLSMQLLVQCPGLELSHQHTSLGEEVDKQIQPSRILTNCCYYSSSRHLSVRPNTRSAVRMTLGSGCFWSL